LVADLFDIEESRTRNVGITELGCTISAGAGHERAAVDRDEIGLAEVLGQPLGGDERLHPPIIASADGAWQSIIAGSIGGSR
jgi:hypothetical protein